MNFQFPQAAGPLNPPIFIFHVVPSKLKTVQEVYLHHGIKVEGIHIVPNNMSAPGMAFKGKTKPDISSGSFIVELYGRKVLEGSLTNILSLKIQGGVQWLPIAAPMNDFVLNYLAFKGTFESMTIIFHGIAFSLGLPKIEPLYPSYLNDLVFKFENSTDLVTKQFKPSNKSKSRKYFEQFVNENPHTMLMEFLRRAPVVDNELLVSELLSNITKSKRSSKVSIQAVGQLVELSFALDLSAISQDYQLASSSLHQLKYTLQLLWKVILYYYLIF
jgi:hypothetical protein